MKKPKFKIGEKVHFAYRGFARDGVIYGVVARTTSSGDTPPHIDEEAPYSYMIAGCQNSKFVENSLTPIQ